MNRLTSKRCNGIKDGYWSPHTKEEIVQRLGSYEDTGMEPEEIRAPRWIPITERLPEENSYVLCAYFIPTARDKSRCYNVLHYYAFNGEAHFQGETMGIQITHWMDFPRLPENPKKAEKPERTAAGICYECRANGDDYWTDGYETVWQCTECPYYDETEEDE